jgi:hypothetical protein
LRAYGCHCRHASYFALAIRSMQQSSEREESRSLNGQSLRNSDRVSFASPTNCPGDGICPSVSEFNQVFSATHHVWNLATFTSIEAGFNVLCIESFLQLVQGLPKFSAPPLDKASLLQTEDELVVECAVQWTTTEHPQCDQPEKLIKLHHLLGYPFPAWCNLCDRTPTGPLYSGLRFDQGSDLSCLILDWSYVLSCRWVEILQSSGHKAFLRHKSLDVTQSTWHSFSETIGKQLLSRMKEPFMPLGCWNGKI